MKEALQEIKPFKGMNTKHICTKHKIMGVGAWINGRLIETCRKCREEQERDPEWQRQEKARIEHERKEQEAAVTQSRLAELRQQFPGHKEITWSNFSIANQRVADIIFTAYGEGKKRGYVFYGGLGTGKTTASYLLACKYLEDRLLDECFRIKSAGLYREALSKKSIIDEIKKVPLLIVDDFAREGVKTDFFRTVFFEVMDYRSEEQKDLVTIITTNLKQQDLAHYLEPTRLGKFFHLIEFDKQIRGIL